jgi:hypothetical protein
MRFRGCLLALVVAAALTEAPGATGDAPPASVFRDAVLRPAPTAVRVQCQRAQARTLVPVLCPTRLPAATLGAWSTPAGTPPPPLSAQVSDYLDRGGRNILLTVGYGAPFEPDFGPGWRAHLWRNRPCCFLHFEVFARARGRSLPTVGGQPAALGGHRGIFLPALGNRVQCGSTSRASFWCNHSVFVWRERGIQYAATLHYFGRGTRALLGRLVAALAPTNAG